MNAPNKIEAPPLNVYQCISAVQADLAHDGIGKNDTNTFDRYKFRGIDAVYNALAPLLAKHGLNILPRILARDVQERVSKKGDPMFYVTVEAEFDLVSAHDGSTHTVRTYGEAMDRSDKATNKAMAAAYKYMAFLTFAIPTEGDNDADASTPEVEARPEPKAEKPKNWGGRYPTKTALKAAMHTHHAELERLGVEGSMDDLEAYLSSPEYKDYVEQASEHASAYLEGDLPETAPPEFIQTFTLEQKARDLIALRGNAPADKEPA